MNKHKGIGLMISGLLLIAAAMLLVFWNLRENHNAARSASELLTEFSTSVHENAEKSQGTSQEDSTLDESEEKERLYGVIQIPVLGLELPVMTGWDYSLLQQAPCRYFGRAEDKNLVICAHNYSSHFGRLNELNEGDLVYFNDWNGVLWTYSVVGVEILQPTAIDELLDDDWPLSLFTCTLGGRTRFVVRCDLVE